MSTLFLKRNPRQDFHDLLLDHLLTVEARFFPGADGLTLEEVLETYTQQARAGRVPDEPKLLALYPQRSEEIREFFVENRNASFSTQSEEAIAS